MKSSKYAVEIPHLVKKMEEALVRGQMERFQSLSKQRSKALNALCAARQNMKKGSSTIGQAELPLNRIEEILKQAIDDNYQLINSAKKAAASTQNKIGQLSKEQNGTRQLSRGYGWRKVLSAGNFASMRG